MVSKWEILELLFKDKITASIDYVLKIVFCNHEQISVIKCCVNKIL